MAGAVHVSEDHLIFVQAEAAGQQIASAGSAGYWLACRRDDSSALAAAYQARSIIEKYDEIAPLIAELRSRYGLRPTDAKAA